MNPTDNISRRHVLKLSAGGLAALAGCSTSEKIDDDPNTYDYQFVEGDDLARDLSQYNDDDKDIATQTPVEWTGMYVREDSENRLRRYVAHPADTEQEFEVLEEPNGPVYQALGEELDTDAHHDTPLQLYGFVDEVTAKLYGADLGEDERDYDVLAFVVEDAEHVDNNGSTEVSGNESG